jgi:hypothetical protein
MFIRHKLVADIHRRWGMDMNKASRGFLSGLGIFVLCSASAFAIPTQPVPASSVPAQVKAPIFCPDAIYRFLPGEFNLCVAARDVQRGRYSSATEMLELAAKWGSKRAQYTLGLMNFKGDHVAVNRPLGLAWLSLAAERRKATYVAVLISAYDKSTPAERRRAVELLSAMRPVYTDAVAARRAQQHFERAMHDLEKYEPYPTNICISGLTGGFMDPNAVQAKCPSMELAVNLLHRVGDAYFDGWVGHVTVGTLKPVEKADADDGADTANPPRQ